MREDDVRHVRRLEIMRRKLLLDQAPLIERADIDEDRLDLLRDQEMVHHVVHIAPRARDVRRGGVRRSKFIVPIGALSDLT